jgi:hypothetical protein
MGSGVFATADFFRVDTFPTGEETAPYGLTRAKGIEHSYPAQRNQVWAAARRAALNLVAQSFLEGSGIRAKTRENPRFDPASGTIQIGEVNEYVKTEVFASRTWKDEIVVKVGSYEGGRTNVTVLRTAIVPSGDALHPGVVDKVSSGNYERWILTQIEDDLAGKIKRETIAVIPLRPTEAPKLYFEYTPSVPAKKPDLNLGFLSPSFFVESIPLTEAPFIGSILKNVGSESGPYLEQSIRSYRKALDAGAANALANHGFRTAGPLQSMEQMTYPQRESSLLVLAQRTVLNIRESFNQAQMTAPEVKKGPVQDSLQLGTIGGKLTLSGHIELELYEPFSREKMWAKMVTFTSDQREFTYKWTYRYEEYFGGHVDDADWVYGEDSRPKVLAEMLSNTFSKTLDDIASALDPSEVGPIYEMAKNLRAKRKY